MFSKAPSYLNKSAGANRPVQKSQQFAATPLSDKISQFKAVRGDEEADGEDAHTRLAMLEQKVN